jgi:hypothetical protein
MKRCKNSLIGLYTRVFAGLSVTRFFLVEVGWVWSMLPQNSSIPLYRTRNRLSEEYMGKLNRHILKCLSLPGRRAQMSLEYISPSETVRGLQPAWMAEGNTPGSTDYSTLKQELNTNASTCHISSIWMISNGSQRSRRLFSNKILIIAEKGHTTHTT